MKQLHVNSLIERIDANGTTTTERLLWIDPSSTACALFDVTDKRAFPVWYDFPTLVIEIEAGTARVLEVDGYATPSYIEDDIPEAYRQRRDRIWQIIQELIPHGPKLFNSVKRGRLISEASQRHHRTKGTILEDLRRYWRGGQTPNALIPHYMRCGAKGRSRNSTEKKRGRPPKSHKNGQQSPGINVNDELRTRIELGIRRFFLNKGRTLKDAYVLTLGEYFRAGVTLDARTGSSIPTLLPIDKLPTFGQYRYWYRKMFDSVEVRKRREGERAYQLQSRGLAGNTRHLAERPGALYQIDATIADIYLVSAYDRTRIIGRPVLYLVSDTFSRLIVGFSVALEGPSWEGACLALENAIADKVQFCRELGVEIEPIEWPSCGLPEAIIGDRGEMEGTNADMLTTALGITIQNTPPYRPDYKGIVERQFRLTNDRVTKWLPGAVAPKRRGGPDYRLDATLTLNEFREVIFLLVLEHGRTSLSRSFPLDQEVVEDKVPHNPTPVELWHWGMRRRSGALRQASPDTIRAALLPSGKASVTERGIQFKGRRYTCDLAQQEFWFDRARQKGRWKIDVTYNPRLTQELYLRDRHAGMVRCHLIDEGDPWRRLDWCEYEDFEALREAEQTREAKRQMEQKLNFEGRITTIVEEAKARRPDTQHMSKTAQTKGIRASRAAEKELERAQRDGFAPSERQVASVPALEPPADDAGQSEIMTSRLELIRGQRPRRQGESDDD